jgi:hypothetical protein
VECAVPTGHTERTSLQAPVETPEPRLSVPSGRLFDLLREDHAILEHMLQAMRDGDDADPAAWQAFVARVTLHCRTEEDALYRLMSRMPQTLDAAEASIEEHDQLLELVETIHAPPTARPAERMALLARLQADLLSHHASEEQTTLPLVAGTFDADELARLAERFVRCRERHLALSRGAETPTGSWDDHPPDVLYEVAQARRIRGRSRMSRAELIAALGRCW